MNTFHQEVQSGERFTFGENWSRFLKHLNEERILAAQESLKQMLEVDNLQNKSFLDIGSGSGLFSLAARRLGAIVYSFDYDPQSVACTKELKQRFYPDDQQWIIEQGSVLDTSYLQRLGQFDIVYSWGVLHHTGAMWQAIDNACKLVNKNGRFFIAIYNDQGKTSVTWRRVKTLYNHLPKALRWMVLWPCFLRLWGITLFKDTLRGRPLHTWRNYGRQSRGMSPWRDVVDWVGGYPFEVAKPEEVFEFLRQRGFQLDRMTTCGGGLGCNQFVMTKVR